MFLDHFSFPQNKVCPLLLLARPLIYAIKKQKVSIEVLIKVKLLIDLVVIFSLFFVVDDSSADEVDELN